MPKVRGLTSALVCALVLIAGTASAQITTGTIIGTVTDSSGGVLPGVAVTIASDKLIGGTQALTTDATGAYRFERLAPGAYSVRFELQGFKTVERKEIQLSATFTATINEKMEVGNLKETITVTGGSPVIDTKSNVQQTVMSQEMLEGIPTGRDLWSVAKLIPGLTINVYDVGGTQGMQASNGMSVHGSRPDDKTYAIDGLAVNWPGGGGGSTMVYYDQGMFEEVNYQTSAIPAEVPIGGIFMNMVSKAGGNVWKGDARYYFANESLQAKNYDSVSAQFGGIPVGNPLKTQYDINIQAGGPLLKDKVEFFGSYRRWRVDKTVMSVIDPTGGHPIDDNLIWNGSGKLTTQLNANHRIGVLYNFNKKNRFHRNDGNRAFIESKATTLQEQAGWTGQIKYTGVLKGASVFESTVGGVSGTYPERYQKNVLPTDIRVEDTVLSTAKNAAARNYENPNYRLQFDNVFSTTKTGKTGTHNFKTGVQFTRQYYQENIRQNGDMVLLYANNVATTVVASNTPVSATSYIHQLGFFGQDSWNPTSKLTLNIGVRADRATGWYPDESSPAGRFVGAARSVPGKDVYKQWLAVWRAGVVYDVKGNGQTAIKGNYSRYGAQVGIGLVTNVNPFTQTTANIAWNDLNGDGVAQANELGTFEGFSGALTTRYPDANGPAWGYSDEITAGVEHQVVKDVRLGVMYYHRTNRNQTGTFNMTVPTSAYTAITIPDGTGTGAATTVYDLKKAYVGLQDNLRQATSVLDTKYDGIEVTASKRFSNRWQMMFGFTAGKNSGGIDNGATADLNDPNRLQYMQGVVGNDAPQQWRVSGSYLLPVADISVATSLVYNTGFPRQITYNVTRTIVPTLVRSSQAVIIDERGPDRLPNVALLDIRFSRPIKFAGNRSLEPQIDLFNALNNDVIVNMVNTVGPRLGYPSEILAPRIIRVGIAFKF